MSKILFDLNKRRPWLRAALKIFSFKHCFRFNLHKNMFNASNKTSKHITDHSCFNPCRPDPGQKEKIKTFLNS